MNKNQWLKIEYYDKSPIRRETNCECKVKISRVMNSMLYTNNKWMNVAVIVRETKMWFRYWIESEISNYLMSRKGHVRKNKSISLKQLKWRNKSCDAENAFNSSKRTDVIEKQTNNEKTNECYWNLICELASYLGLFETWQGHWLNIFLH